MADSAVLTLPCPAKVNLALSVGPPNSEGMHPIASWFIALDFGDRLTLTRAGSTSYDVDFADDAPRPGVVDWPLEKDLAVRAHRMLEAHVGHSLPLQLTLRKRVPTGAGLGGGSSDAAAVLVGVNRLCNLGLTQEKLIELASRLGSDVPFFVAVQHGTASAVVTGTGHAIEPVPLARPVHLALMFPDVACPTAAVYRRFDQMHPRATAPRTLHVRTLASGVLTPELPFNDLAPAAMTTAPTLGPLQRDAAALLGRPVHVSGSGSALFAVGWDDTEARDLAARARRWLNIAAVAARSR